MILLNILRKISVIFFILVFSLLSVNTLITSFSGGNVYASSNVSVTCGDLVQAISPGPSSSSVVTDIGNSNGSIPLKSYASSGNSWNGGSRIVAITVITQAINGGQNLKTTYQCSTGHAGIPIPSGTAYLEYEGNTSKPNGQAGTWIWYVDAIPVSSSTSIPSIPTVNSITSPSNVSGSNIISTLFSDILPILYGLLAVIVIALISYAGFLWMTSNGDTQKIARAKSVLTGVVIGVSIIALAYAISLLAVSIL